MVERVRASRVKAGLTCEGVRLYGLGQSLDCCPECHAPDSPVHSPHMLQWVEGPGGVHANVCCKLNRPVRQAFQKGKWPEKKDYSINALMAKQFAEHPSWVASHLPKVVSAKWFDGTIGSSSHKACRYLELIPPQGDSSQEVLCVDPECKGCGMSLTLYWSYTLQAWVPMKWYGLIDNALHLSPVHSSHAHACQVPGHVVMNNVTHVPEYAAFCCSVIKGGSAYQMDPIAKGGSAYLMNPMFGAAIGTPDGVKYVVHLVAGPVNALKEMAAIVPLIEKVVNH